MGEETGPEVGRLLLPGAEASELLEQILEAVPAGAIGQLQRTNRFFLKVGEVLWRKKALLLKRGLNPDWSWRKAHACEQALFWDTLGRGSSPGGSPGSSGSQAPRDTAEWSPGPNDSVECNVLERWPASDSSSDDSKSSVAPWLWLSGGTDWQGFQGTFRCLSAPGVRPAWVSFRIRIQTLGLSGAFLALSHGQHTWGLSEPIFLFNYSGDERASQRRCFVVQTGSTQQGNPSYVCRVQPEIVMDQPYEVAVHFDWDNALLSVFIDGQQHVHRIPFRACQPIRFAALYNWRSGARTAFSELMLGNVCPCILEKTLVTDDAHGVDRLQLCPCQKRKSKQNVAKRSTFTPVAWMLTSAAVALFAAAVQSHVYVVW